MTIKQVFKMIENVNAFNDLVGDKKRNYIGLTDDKIFTLKDKNDNSRFYTLNEMQKALNYTYTKDEIKKIMNIDFKQNDNHKNYFEFEKYEMGIYEN